MIRFRFFFFLCGITLLSSVARAEPSPDSTKITWRSWSPSIFEEAKRQHKFVLLDLQAVWCHWCHVMDAQTYTDPKVIALIQSHYIAVKVDQDSNLDLANRYEDYGWPATVVYNSDGGEIVKRSGFLPPIQMASILQAIIDDPSPGPSVKNELVPHLNGVASLPDSERQALRQQLLDGYDSTLGSWGTNQKFMNWDNVEYCLVQAQSGDVAAKMMATQTLTAQLQLIDSVWGGVDQYSAEGDWNHPHFEKIMQFQAENIRAYAEAYALWKDPVYLQSAQQIYGYVRHFLTSPEGVVYVSQDADLVAGQHSGDYYKLDDVARRKLGIPRIDKHIYARENGWFIQALSALYTATGDTHYRDEAIRTANWIIKNRAASGGGFHHGEETTGSIYLGDTLSMGRAFLSLYAITGDSQWLDRSEKAISFMTAHFAYKVDGAPIGFATSANGSDINYVPRPEFDENVYLARFANLLFHYTGSSRDHQVAEIALRYATSPDLTHARRSMVGALLLAENELDADPIHIAIVGSRKDKTAQDLFVTAVQYPAIYKQVEWFDLRDKSSAHPSITYPDLPRSAAYLCTNNACSSPVFDVAHLQELLKRRTGPSNGVH